MCVQCTRFCIGEYILPQLFVHTHTHCRKFPCETRALFLTNFSLSYLDAMCLTLVVICILLSFMTLKTGITIKLQFVNCGVTRFQCRLFIPLILLWLCHTNTQAHTLSRVCNVCILYNVNKTVFVPGKLFDPIRFFSILSPQCSISFSHNASAREYMYTAIVRCIGISMNINWDTTKWCKWSSKWHLIRNTSSSNRATGLTK